MGGRQSAEVVSNRELVKGVYDIRLKVGRGVCEQSLAGQFFNVYLDADGMLLPRPLGICDVTGGDCLRAVYRVAGSGTAALSTLKHGAVVDILAPLGNGFPMKALRDKRVLIVGGGLGIAPLLRLAKDAGFYDAVLGYPDETFLADEFEYADCNVYVATDSGRTGFKGNVVGLMSTIDKQYDVVCACGPTPMMRAVAAWAAERGIDCYVSLEERMGCGYGACVGCVCDTVGGYKKVCVDGPVFDAKEVIL